VQNFNQFLKKELNQPQLKAVTHKQGPVIVISGAGSGKTRVITARIANLILNENANPNSIIALTFTNKAAGEMKHRLIKFLGTKHNLPFVGTFHSYCLLLLRSHPTLLPHPEFTILDADDQKSLIKKIIKKNGLEKQLSAADVGYQISNLKNKLLTPFDSEGSFTQPIIKEIYLAYETEKNATHNLDFDDLILQFLKIIKEKKDFRQKFQAKIKHILVDEYQDTNMVQHELLRCMSLDTEQKLVSKSICAVGDEDQSIYSWRGAMATNMLQFQKDFAPVTIIKIEQNYRSVQPILEAANYVITHNKVRTPKELWSQKNAKNRILSINCRSGQQEADAIATFISSYPKDQKLSNVAILYRTHFQSRNIEEALIRNSIPYQIVGGIRFYERKEIKDLLAYLRLIVNPFDWVSLFRVINCPQRGLGTKFEELLYEQWNKNPLLNFKQLLDYMLLSPKIKLTGTKAKSVQEFLDIFTNLEKDQNASELINHILEQTAYLKYLQKAYDPKEAESKIENVKELEQSIYNFENKVFNEKTPDTNELTLETFLHEIALMQEKIKDNKNKENEVQCMTLHAAKGLEFDTVIITGLEEGMLPSNRSLNTSKALEEERRLFYVGMTRAKERLILFKAYYRNSFGQILDQVTSRFLTEIPEKLLKSLDVSEMYSSQVESYFNKWLGNKSSVLTFQDFAKNLKPKLKAKTNKPTTNWKKNQPVIHKKFGTGIIKKIEKKDEAQFYITALFKCGEKKILSNFLQRL
jgi:DNA helicase II / ATP-dependent DNA helicase PcrA